MDALHSAFRACRESFRLDTAESVRSFKPVILKCMGEASSDPQCGGKGRQLGQIAQQGIPVPPFVVVPTSVYLRMVQHSPKLLMLASQCMAGAGELGDLAIIRAEIKRLKFDDDVIADIADFLALLPYCATVSCRSSATIEDGAALSFAGQFDTILNQSTLDGILTSILDCYCSLFADHIFQLHASTSYAAGSSDYHMAVVIQQQIDSAASGVAFTCNPANGIDTELVVEAIWGQGEGLVQGEITPDHFVVDQPSGRVLLSNVIVKTEEFVLAPSGGAAKVSVSG